MLNLSFALGKDVKESARIERARQYEDERKNRIFNARNRLIGVDKTALEKQIAEKKARDEEEKAKEEAFYLKLIRDDQIAAQFEKEIQDKKRRLNEEINKYRAQCQRKEDRREFDLYDPEYLKKSLPARVLDDDPRLSISGAQKFEGEDINSEKRQKYQKQQQKAWLQQQIDDRLRAEKEKRSAENMYAEMIAARDERAKQLDNLEMQCKKQLDEATMRFNQALASEQETQRRMQEMRDLEDKRAEIYNACTGDFLTENPDAAKSCLGPSRIVSSAYKGMSPSEKDAVRKEQIRQIEENKQRRAEEKKLANDWGDLANHFANVGTMTNEEIMKRQRELTRQLFEQNRLLCAEQRRNKEIMDQEFRTNVPTEEFYDQFNKTTR